MLFVAFGQMIARTLEEQMLRWLRSAELTCDRAALLVAQDPKVPVLKQPKNFLNQNA